MLEATSPATRARQSEAVTVPVLQELVPLLPGGGLIRSTATEVGDPALLIQLAAAPAAEGQVWSAVVDIPEFGDAATRSAGLLWTAWSTSKTPKTGSPTSSPPSPRPSVC